MQGIWEMQQNVANNIVMAIGRGAAVKRAPQRIRIEGDCWEFMASDDGPVKDINCRSEPDRPRSEEASPATLDLVQLGFAPGGGVGIGGRLEYIDA